MRAREPLVKGNGAAPVPRIEDVHTPEEMELYLQRIRDGIGLDLAAREIGSTSTRMRRYGYRDAEWAARVAEAYEAGCVHYRDRLRAQARLRALDPSDRFSARILEVELATHVPGYEHLKRDRMKVSGHVQHEHAVTIALDPAVLDGWSVEKLEAFKAMLHELAGAETVEAEVLELPEGDSL
jgi:hypothetical protein